MVVWDIFYILQGNIAKKFPEELQTKFANIIHIFHE